MRYFGHSHGKEMPDPHIWLNPRHVKIQATTIYEYLKKTDPQNTQFYKHNLENFLSELNDLDTSLTLLLAIWLLARRRAR